MTMEQTLHITPALMVNYKAYLHNEERSVNTISKYMRDLRVLYLFLNGEELNKENLLEWKERLMKTYAPTSVNSMLAAANGFLEWAGLPQYKMKPLKIQHDAFSKPEKELTYEEYKRLVKTAEREKNHRLSLLLQTICATGIRVSELQYITVEAVETGRVIVNCKGKARTVFLSAALRRVLHHYCREKNLEEGVIFCTKNGHFLDRSNIWKDMKDLCEKAGVDPGKGYPHNLRHLFARTHYRLEKDLSRLADLLGHSNVATTRIYTMESGIEHAKQLDRMGLVFA